MFSLSPFDMMMYQPSHVHHQRPVYVQSPYQRYARPSQHVYVEDAQDELAEYVARVRAAEQARADAERQLAYQQQQLAQAKKAAYLRAVEQKRQQREAEQAAFYQALQAERERRQKLYEQQMNLRDNELKLRYEQQRQLQQQQAEQEEKHDSKHDPEEQMKLDLLNQLFGDVFGQHLSRQIERQSMNKQTPVKQQVKPSIKEEQQVKPSIKKEQRFNHPAASPSKASGQVESPFFIPVRVINSAGPSQKQPVQSSAPSRVSVPLTINTAPSSPVQIEDEPITPEQWNLDASDVFKADRVLTPSPSEPVSPKPAVPAAPVEQSNDQSISRSSKQSDLSVNNKDQSVALVDQTSDSIDQTDTGLDQSIEQSTNQSTGAIEPVETHHQPHHRSECM